ncbi:MAG: DUF7405 family protein, partial [Halobacteriota archaeon]
MQRDFGGQSRRSVLKAAVAIGGVSALSACLDRFDDDPIPTGTADTDSLPRGQHEWNDHLERDEWGNVVLPEHHLFAYLTLDRDGTPTAADRETVEAAFETMQRAFEWSNRGVVFEIGYSRSYFDRFDEPLADAVDLPEPRALSPIETPTFDTHDALLHLASDRGAALLAIEAAMFGDPDDGDGQSDLNGIAV